jgi:hypothetical protein
MKKPLTVILVSEAGGCLHVRAESELIPPSFQASIQLEICGVWTVVLPRHVLYLSISLSLALS